MSADCGRADLVRLLQAGETGLFERAIGALDFGLLGFAPRPPAPPEPTVVPILIDVEHPSTPLLEPEPEPRPSLRPTEAAYLRVVESHHVAPEDLTKVEVTELPRGKKGEDTAPRTHPPDPLVPWPRLWRRLRTHLCQPVLTREVDVPAVVARMARGHNLRNMPRLRRARLAAQPGILTDRNSNQIPFWNDQDYVAANLARWIAHASGEALPILPGVSPLARLALGYPDLAAPDLRGRMVVLLGDLGAYGGDGACRAWHETGLWLLRQGATLRALVPAPWWRVDKKLAKLWNAIPWDEREGRAVALDPCDRRARADRLLALLAPALRIEPGLVRRARRRFFPGGNDSGTEVDVFCHPAVIGASAEALSLDPKRKKDLEAEFDKFDPRVKDELRRLLHEWHKELRPEVSVEERFQLYLRSPVHFDDKEWSELRDFILQAAKAIDTQDAVGSLVPDVAAWARDFFTRAGEKVWTDAELAPALRRAWAVAHRDIPNVVLPPGFTPEDLQILHRGPARVPTCWRLWQVGEGLVARPAEVSSTGGEPVPRPKLGAAGKARVGSPLAEIVAADPRLLVEGPAGEAPSYALSSEAAPIPVVEGGVEIVLKTDCQELTLAAYEKPAWAKRSGRDAFGLWAEFEYKGVAQRLRWIPPGRFLMGSPEDEPDRWKEGEVQHEVELTQGYWLADTACTQELWEAVMGTNPSHFKEGGASRPVEQVSWEDCQEFLRKLDAEIQGEDGSGHVVRLPTEAEWEYACRAGTTTPFSFGANITPELVNYDGNYPYAGGAKGKYREKTVPVKSLPANPWGLFEMHGNVWEWCEDWFETYSGAPVQDPLGKNPSVGHRVVRGGSWNDFARRVRSAYRLRYEPGLRFLNFGFRFARGRPVGQDKQATAKVARGPAEASGASRREGRERPERAEPQEPPKKKGILDRMFGKGKKDKP